MLATALLALLPLVAATPVVRQDGVNAESLKVLAERQNKYIGTAYQSFYLADERFEPILDGEFDQYTPENEMKWEVIQAERGVFNWTGSDLVSRILILLVSYTDAQIIEQAQKTGSIVRGHNLVWHSQLPPWVQNITDAEDLKSVMKGHIDAVLGRYGDKLAHMDVVNERTSATALLRTMLIFSLPGQWYIPRQCLVQPPR